MSAETPELTPEIVDEDIAVWLVVTAASRDGSAFTFAHQSEKDARDFLTNFGGSDTYRFARVVKVRVPRGLLVERWSA